METQMNLNTSLWAKEQVLDQLENAYRDWLRNVGVPALYLAAKRHALLTTDEVRVVLEEMGEHVLPGKGERRGSVLGALMRQGTLPRPTPEGETKPFLAPTGLHESSTRRRAHARKLTLWRSLVFEAGDYQEERVSFLTERGFAYKVAVE